MNQWFGEPWPSPEFRAPVCADDALRVPVPLGAPCFLCDELIDEADQGQMFPYTIGVDDDGNTVLKPGVAGHRECMLRNVVGCYGNLVGEEHSHDVPYREDARRVQEYFERHPEF